MIASNFPRTKHICEIPTSLGAALNTGGSIKINDFRPIYRFTSEIIQDRAIDSVECVTVSKLSSGTVFNDWVTFEGHFSTIVILCAQFTRNLLAIAKFLVCFGFRMVD